MRGGSTSSNQARYVITISIKVVIVEEASVGSLHSVRPPIQALMNGMLRGSMIAMLQFGT